MQKSNERNSRKERIGIVKSNKMNKTITVVIDRISHHPVYDKLVKTHSTLKAHDEKNAAKLGGTVEIEESGTSAEAKGWRLVDMLKK